MKKALWLLASVAVGALAGLGLTSLAVEHPPNFGVIRIGPWVARPGIGATSADPYSKALISSRGEIPMGAAEGLMLVAETDSSGHSLHLSCSYIVSGMVPAAAYWTLTVYRSDGVNDPAVRQSYTSTESLLAEDGSVRITLASDPQPGNWIPLRGRGHFSLYLRLYETQVSSTVFALDKVSAPVITREHCP